MRTARVFVLVPFGLLLISPRGEPQGLVSTQQSIKGVELKNLAPVSTELLSARLPRPTERKLRNGLRLVMIENHRTPTVTLDLVLPASTLNDPVGLAGLAECVAHMLKQGTTSRSSRQISEILSELGASMGISVTYGTHATHLVASVLTKYVGQMLDLVSDILLNASFPQHELEKWKIRQQSQIEQARS